MPYEDFPLAGPDPNDPREISQTEIDAIFAEIDLCSSDGVPFYGPREKFGEASDTPYPRPRNTQE